jgi:hypothetical protein
MSGTNTPEEPGILVAVDREAETITPATATEQRFPLRAIPREAPTAEYLSLAYASKADFWHCPSTHCKHQNPNTAEHCQKCKAASPRTDEDRLSVPSMVEDSGSQLSSEGAGTDEAIEASEEAEREHNPPVDESSEGTSEASSNEWENSLREQYGAAYTGRTEGSGGGGGGGNEGVQESGDG